MRFPSRLALSSLLLTAAGASVLHAQQRDRTARPKPAVLAARVDSVVRTDVLAQGMPSVSVAIVRGGDVVLARAWGMADAVTARKAEPLTPYQLGSVSKTFTAALILKLADRGKLSISDPISRHFPGLRPEWRAITIEQLLNHTSGLKAEFRQVGTVNAPRSRDSLWALAVHDTLANVPGTTYVYSNTGYMVLGALVERRYGKSYADVLRDEIAKPLGLQSLHVCEVDDPRVARGHIRVPNAKANHIEPFHPSLLLGNGGLCATASDLAKWNRALHGGRVVSAASYAAMTTPRGAAAVARNYGLELFVRPTAWGPKIMLHEGATRGYATANAWYPAESLSVVVLYNRVPRLSKDVGDIIAQLAHGLTPRVAAAPAPQPTPGVAAAAPTGPRAPADAVTLVGEYEMSPGMRITVTLTDGVLRAIPPAAMGGAGQVLLHESGTTYRFGAAGGTKWTFVLDTAGALTAVRLLPTGGRERTLQKVK